MEKVQQRSTAKQQSTTVDYSRGLIQPLKKFALSAFVVLSFGAYAIHERMGNPQNMTNALVPTDSAPNTSASLPSSGSNTGSNANAQAPLPTATTRNAAYKDGDYTGDVANAFYGTVQVKAIIRNGQITDVQFLDYPHDRRTSQFINSQAMPYLTQEAVQAQNAYVDIISGATLTSQAFVESLQTALNQAKA